MSPQLCKNIVMGLLAVVFYPSLFFSFSVRSMGFDDVRYALKAEASYLLGIFSSVLMLQLLRLLQKLFFDLG